MIVRTRLGALVLNIIGVFFWYFGILAQVKENNEGLKRGKNKEIVAFSLRKLIEIESEEVNCSGKILVGKKIRKSGRKINQKWTQVDGTNIFIYSIYFDRRLHPHNYLRIIAMVKDAPSQNVFCQITTSDYHYHITKAIITKIWSKSWNQNDTHLYYNPILISCHLPINKTSIYISLNKNSCQIGQQKFKINPVPNEIQNSFTICVKPLNFLTDISQHLFQWIIMNQILGAGKIEFYLENIQDRTRQFLQTLENYLKGGLTLHDHQKIVQEATYHDQSTHIWQKRRYEIVAYNDCLYRNIHTSHFVIPLDIDEIIVPRHESTWAEIFNQTQDNFASYTVRNAYYLEQFNGKQFKDNIFFFRNTVRSDFSKKGESGKSFVSTKNTLTVFNHYALRSLKPGIGIVKFLNKSLVQMNHYKDSCDIKILPECAKYLSSHVRVVDKIVFKYRKIFFEKYNILLNLLNTERILGNL